MSGERSGPVPEVSAERPFGVPPQVPQYVPWHVLQGVRSQMAVELFAFGTDWDAETAATGDHGGLCWIKPSRGY